VLAHGGADGGDKQHNTLELLHMAKKTLKITKKTRKKHVEEEGDVRKGEKVRGRGGGSSWLHYALIA
jgi:hypothetical protein